MIKVSQTMEINYEKPSFVAQKHWSRCNLHFILFSKRTIEFNLFE